MKIQLIESEPEEFKNPESIDKFNKAMRDAKRALYKAAGQPDGTVYAIDELSELIKKSYTSRLKKMSDEIVKEVRKAHK